MQPRRKFQRHPHHWVCISHRCHTCPLKPATTDAQISSSPNPSFPQLYARTVLVWLNKQHNSPGEQVIKSTRPPPTMLPPSRPPPSTDRPGHSSTSCSPAAPGSHGPQSSWWRKEETWRSLSVQFRAHGQQSGKEDKALKNMPSALNLHSSHEGWCLWPFALNLGWFTTVLTNRVQQRGACVASEARLENTMKLEAGLQMLDLGETRHHIKSLTAPRLLYWCLGYQPGRITHCPRPPTASVHYRTSELATLSIQPHWDLGYLA